MRWQFVDCVDRYRPWSRIEGRKTVSFEEYSLLDVFGQSGVLPPALALESLVCLIAVGFPAEPPLGVPRKPVDRILRFIDDPC